LHGVRDASQAGIPESLRRTTTNSFCLGWASLTVINDKTPWRQLWHVQHDPAGVSVLLAYRHRAERRAFVNNVVPTHADILLPQTRTAGSGVRGVPSGNPSSSHAPDRLPSALLDAVGSDSGIGCSRRIWACDCPMLANKSTDLPWAPDLNPAQPSTTYSRQRPLTDVPSQLGPDLP